MNSIGISPGCQSRGTVDFAHPGAPPGAAGIQPVFSCRPYRGWIGMGFPHLPGPDGHGLIPVAPDGAGFFRFGVMAVYPEAWNENIDKKRPPPRESVAASRRGTPPWARSPQCEPELRRMSRSRGQRADVAVEPTRLPQLEPELR